MSTVVITIKAIVVIGDDSRHHGVMQKRIRIRSKEKRVLLIFDHNQILTGAMMRCQAVEEVDRTDHRCPSRRQKDRTWVEFQCNSLSSADEDNAVYGYYLNDSFHLIPDNSRNTQMTVKIQYPRVRSYVKRFLVGTCWYAHFTGWWCVAIHSLWNEEREKNADRSLGSLTCFASPTSQIIVLNATSPSACFCCIKAILSANFRGLLMINVLMMMITKTFNGDAGLKKRNSTWRKWSRLDEIDDKRAEGCPTVWMNVSTGTIRNELFCGRNRTVAKWHIIYIFAWSKREKDNICRDKIFAYRRVSLVR